MIRALNQRNMDHSSGSLTVPHSAWDTLPESKKNVASDRGRLVREVLRIMENENESQRSAVELCLLRLKAGDHIDENLITVAKTLGCKGKLPSYSTLTRWVKSYNKAGLVGLAPDHKGSECKAYGWEARAAHLYSLPSKPSISAVARKLITEGFADVTETRVRRYINNLPADQGEMSRGRLGSKLFNNTQKTFKRRSTENLPVGSIYSGDGHTLDLYLQHPTGNKPWRAELTLYIDVTSRYVVGWYVSEAESANSTLFALSHALLSLDHIPAYLHIDNGSGYKNKMMSDEATGFYARFGVSIMHSLPYNAKGKGHVERFFGTMERDCNKWFESYCGEDMADEAIQLLLKKVKKGEKQLPTLEQWMDAFTTWLDQYHNKPHRGLNGKTPAELWATLERHPVEPRSAAIFWPRTTRTVSRECVRLDNREYMAPQLIQYNGRKVQIEYNLHDDAVVRILDDKGRWVCDASLVNKVDYIPSSRIEEAKQKRLRQQIKRLEVHANEKLDRAGLAVTHDQVLDDVELLVDDTPALPKQKAGPALTDPAHDQDDELVLDITDISYIED